MKFRLLTYNILKGGTGREALIAHVINSCTPDLVLLQEATRPSTIERIAGDTGMGQWSAGNPFCLARRFFVPFSKSGIMTRHRL